jgi:hypothetical protein
VGKPDGKGPLGRPRRRWQNNIKMEFHEVGWGVMDWNADNCEIGNEHSPQNEEKFLIR